jgi:hypothetical protein
MEVYLGHCSTFLSYPASRSRGQKQPPHAFVGAGRRRIDGEDADTHNLSAGGAKEEEYIDVAEEHGRR